MPTAGGRRGPGLQGVALQAQREGEGVPWERVCGCGVVSRGRCPGAWEGRPAGRARGVVSREGPRFSAGPGAQAAWAPAEAC